MQIVVFANSVDPDEADHHEPAHLDLHCLSSRHRTFNMIILDEILQT